MTLHSALQLAQLKNMLKSNRSRTQKDLIDYWIGVDYLFIDEVSMIGCELLVDINDALIIAKESNEPFGNMSIIFAGDFCQLLPVRNTRLYASECSITSKPSDSLTDNGQKKLKGKFLWGLVETVVLLVTSMRQTGDSNLCFRILLEHL